MRKDLFEESDFDIELRSALDRYPRYTVVTEVGRIRFEIERNDLLRQLNDRSDDSNDGLLIHIEIVHDCNWIVIHPE